MARKKEVQALIADDVMRRNTLKKRRKGLLKKMNEFTTLCDVEASVVVYGPNDAEPEVWPDVPEAMMMFQSFQELPKIKQRKKMMDQEIFLEKKITKTIQRYRRLEKQIQEMEDSIRLYEFMSGRDMDELDLQGARQAYYIAGLRQKEGYEQLESMAVKGSSPECVNYPPLTKTDYYLDDAIARSANEPMVPNQNQFVSSNFNHQNRPSVPNLSQKFMIQRPDINYVENQNQPYASDQILMHPQATDGSSSNNMETASSDNQQLMFQQSANGFVQNEGQAMASSADEGHQHLADMEDDISG